MFVKKEGNIFGRYSQVPSFFIDLNSAPGWDGFFLRKMSKSEYFCPSKGRADGKWGNWEAKEGRWREAREKKRKRATEAEGLGGQDHTGKGGSLEN